jgi:hypothetical protein
MLADTLYGLFDSDATLDVILLTLIVLFAAGDLDFRLAVIHRGLLEFLLACPGPTITSWIVVLNWDQPTIGDHMVVTVLTLVLRDDAIPHPFVRLLMMAVVGKFPDAVALCLMQIDGPDRGPLSWVDYEDQNDAMETLTLFAHSSSLLAKIVVGNVTARFVIESFREANQRCGAVNHPDIDKFLGSLFDFIAAICVGVDIDDIAETNPEMNDVIWEVIAFAIAEGGGIWSGSVKKSVIRAAEFLAIRIGLDTFSEVYCVMPCDIYADWSDEG